MANEKLFKNTFGCIVQIAGPMPAMIGLVNSVVSFDALEEGSTEGHEAKFSAVLKKGLLTYIMDESSVVCVNLKDKVFLQDSKILLHTKPKAGTMCTEPVLLAFQTIDGLKVAKDALTARGIGMKDLTGTVGQYETFDKLWESYQASLAKKLEQAKIKSVR